MMNPSIWFFSWQIGIYGVRVRVPGGPGGPQAHQARPWACGSLIRLQRIYNFWLLHAMILSVLDVNGFILHFYIIFGTNLLTGGPARIAVFLPILVFQRKGISNGVQMKWNLRGRSFWNKRDPEDLECKSRSNRGDHEGGGHAWVGRRAPYLVASLLVAWRMVQVSWVLFVPKITFPKVSFRLDSVWYSFSSKP